MVAQDRRLTVEKVGGLKEFAGWTLVHDSYVGEPRCGCIMALLAYVGFGEHYRGVLFDTVYEAINTSPIAQRFGVSKDYLKGLECGFEDWRIGEMGSIKNEEDFKLGYEDGKEIRDIYAPVDESEVA